MKLLLYTYPDCPYLDLYNALISMGYCVDTLPVTLAELNENPERVMTETKRFMNLGSYDAVVSFLFLPQISDIAEAFSIPYISWVYDSPSYTLLSNAVYNSCNYIFVFDRNQQLHLQEKNIANVYHLPLAVDTARLIRQLGDSPWLHDSSFTASFVGTLYTDENYNLSAVLPDYYKGYVEGLLHSQQIIYGDNFIYDLVSPELAEIMKRYIPVSQGENVNISRQTIYADFLSKELTKRDRIYLLNSLCRHMDVDLFSASDPAVVPAVNYHGYVDYVSEMPVVFATSKINLNFTLRSITSGIPLRALDIMGAGGFLLSNYQPELAEYFIDGEECVLFSSEQDLIDKASYYLHHDAERMQIAQRGCRKIRQEFSYEAQIRKMFQLVGLTRQP